MLVSVPMGSAESHFMFEEVTADFQSLTIQGKVMYQVRKSQILARNLDLALVRQAVLRCLGTIDN